MAWTKINCPPATLALYLRGYSVGLFRPRAAAVLRKPLSQPTLPPGNPRVDVLGHFLALSLA